MDNEEIKYKHSQSNDDLACLFEQKGLGSRSDVSEKSINVRECCFIPDDRNNVSLECLREQEETVSENDGQETEIGVHDSSESNRTERYEATSDISLFRESRSSDTCRNCPTENKLDGTENLTIADKDIKMPPFLPCVKENKFSVLDDVNRIRTNPIKEEVQQTMFFTKECPSTNTEEVAVSQDTSQETEKTAPNSTELEDIQRTRLLNLKNEEIPQSVVFATDSFISNAEQIAAPLKISTVTEALTFNASELDDIDQTRTDEETQQNRFSSKDSLVSNTAPVALSQEVPRVPGEIALDFEKGAGLEYPSMCNIEDDLDEGEDETFPRTAAKSEKILRTDCEEKFPLVSSFEFHKCVTQKRGELEESTQEYINNDKIPFSRPVHGSSDISGLESKNDEVARKQSSSCIFDACFSGSICQDVHTDVKLQTEQSSEKNEKSDPLFSVDTSHKEISPLLKIDFTNQSANKISSQDLLKQAKEGTDEEASSFTSPDSSKTDDLLLLGRTSDWTVGVEHEAGEIVTESNFPLNETSPILIGDGEQHRTHVLHETDKHHQEISSSVSICIEKNANTACFSECYVAKNDSVAEKESHGVEKSRNLNKESPVENGEFTVIKHTNIPPFVNGKNEEALPFMKDSGDYVIINNPEIAELKQDETEKFNSDSTMNRYLSGIQYVANDLEINETNNTVVEQVKLRKINEKSDEDITPRTNLKECHRTENNMKANIKNENGELQPKEKNRTSDEDTISIPDWNWTTHMGINVNDRRSSEVHDHDNSETEFGSKNDIEDCASQTGNRVYSSLEYAANLIGRCKNWIDNQTDSYLKVCDWNTIDCKQEHKSTALHNHASINVERSSDITATKNALELTARFSRQSHGLDKLQNPQPKCKLIHQNENKNMKQNFCNKQLSSIDEKDLDIKTLGDALTYFNLWPEVDKLEMSIENVRRKMKSEEEHKKDFNEVDKHLLKLSLRFHPDKIKNRRGSDKEIAVAQKLQSSLNITRKVLSILDDAFLENLETDHKYVFYANLSIASLGNEDKIKNHVYDILFKFGLISEIKQRHIIAEVQKFLIESKHSVRCLTQSKDRDFERHRDSALHHLNCCIEGYKKLLAEFDVVEAECRKEKLDNIASSLSGTVEENGAIMRILESLEKVAGRSLSGSLEIFDTSEKMDDYFVLPLVCFVNVMLLCSVFVKNKAPSFWRMPSQQAIDVIKANHLKISKELRFLSYPFLLALYIDGDSCRKFILRNSSMMPSSIRSDDAAKEEFLGSLLPVYNYLEENFKTSNYEVGSARGRLMEELNSCIKMMSDFKAKEKDLTNDIKNFKRKTDERDEKYDAVMRRTEEFNRKVKERLEKSKTLMAETAAALSRDT